MSLAYPACDLCGSTAFKPLYPGTISNPSRSPEIYFSSSRSQAGHFPIVRCTRCGLARSYPRDSNATLDAIYSQMVDGAYESEENNRTATAQSRLEKIRGFTPPGRLLDLGCSSGIFINEAFKTGWQVTGVDPSPWAIQLARKRCPAAKVFTGQIELIDFPPASFECVTLWDVLEHLSSPFSALEHIQPWLMPGSWLVMNLPNMDSPTARWMGRHWVLLLREHLWYFSTPTIRQMLERTGFQVVEMQPNQVRFSSANILLRLSQYRKFASRLAGRLAKLPFIKGLSFTFPIGDTFIVARKG